jgi:hypothetical protein
MNNEDRIAIEGVFSRLQEVERQGGPREPEAEQFIRSRIEAQPGAAYYLAQTVLVQEHALKTAQQKITELEQRAAAPAPAAAPQEGFAANAARQSGGLSAGYFGRNPPASQEASPPLSAAGTPLSAAGTPLSAAGTPLQGGMPPPGSQFGQSGQAQAGQAQAAPSRAGGFLAGAAQTAMGVAGGMMLGSLLGGMFGGGAAHAAAKPAEPAPEVKPEPTADAGSHAQDNATSDAQFDPPNDSANNVANNTPSDTSDYASTDVGYDNSDSGFGFFDDGGDFDDV